MRHLSAPVRWAAVTALTIVASTGCMSVGDDGARPGPSRSADEKGGDAEPDGTVPDSGTAGAGRGLARTHSDREIPGEPDPDASGATSSAAPADRRRPPVTPPPTLGGRPPAPTLSAPGPAEPSPVTPEPPSPSDPGPDPDPDPKPSQPSEPPTPPPSASPAAQLRAGAMTAPRRPEMLRTPEASPQVGPV